MLENELTHKVSFWLGGDSLDYSQRALSAATLTNVGLSFTVRRKIEAGIVLLREGLRALFLRFKREEVSMMLTDEREVISGVRAGLRQVADGVQDTEDMHVSYVTDSQAQELLSTIATLHKGQYLFLYSICVKDMRLLEENREMRTQLGGAGASSMPYGQAPSVLDAYLAASAADVWLEIIEAVRNQKLYRELEDHIDIMWRASTGLEGEVAPSAASRCYCEALRLLLVCHNNSAVLRKNIDVDKSAREFVRRLTREGKIVEN